MCGGINFKTKKTIREYFLYELDYLDPTYKEIESDAIHNLVLWMPLGFHNILYWFYLTVYSGFIKLSIGFHKTKNRVS